MRGILEHCLDLAQVVEGERAAVLCEQLRVALSLVGGPVVASVGETQGRNGGNLGRGSPRDTP